MVAQKERSEELTRHLSEELSSREWTIAEKRHTEDTVTVKEKLTKQGKQFSVRVTELEGEIVKGTETVMDPNVEMKAAKKHAEDVSYESNGLQACFQLSQCGQVKVSENITCVQHTIICFATGLKGALKYMERRTDEE